MKILNLYCGAGGNRSFWGEEHDITAVELDENIAKIYNDRFPNDNIIIGDAHEYLLNNYMNYDFIWSSPPCPTHSDIRRCGVHRGQNDAVYPDMKLYQEIILMMHFAPKETLYAIENVKPYYKPLISAQEAGRHLWWSNFYIHEFKGNSSEISDMNTEKGKIKHGFSLDGYIGIDKRKVYRNCVDAKLGKHVLNCATKYRQQSLFTV